MQLTNTRSTTNPKVGFTKFLLLFYLCFSCIQAVAGLNNSKVLPKKVESEYARNTDHILTKKSIPLKTTNFIPGIAIIKTGVAADVLGAPSCATIQYSYTITNESTEGELLENIIVTDDVLGVIPGPPVGDDNNNNILDIGEIWVFESEYNITQADIQASQVTSNAIVEANVVGDPGNVLSDISDNDSILENEDTVIDLTQCQANIAVVKTSETLSADGNPDGCNAILYTFTVTNEGPVILENIVLTDPIIGPDPITNLISGDNNSDTFLDVDEVWVYTAIYNITEQDIINGTVENQATVTADVQGQPGESVSDLSHPTNVTEDAVTVTDLTRCQADIGLVKTSEIVNTAGTPFCERIRYTFQVFNPTLQPLENVTLTDPLLGGEVPGPDSGDNNNNGLLDSGEIWIYIAEYIITQADINFGAVVNQATVTANALAQPFNFASDLSDFESFSEDRETVTDLTPCQFPQIAIVKTSEFLDLDEDTCSETIRYTLVVTNEGNVDLTDVEVTDPLFNGLVAGPVSGDEFNDGILGLEEIWKYVVLYPVQQEDIDLGQVENQAIATGGNLAGTLNVSDSSDDNSVLEDDPTITIVRDDSCIDGSASVAVIKEGVLIDADGDGCFESILYTFTVTNNGSIDLEEIVLEDQFLGGEIVGPISDTDVNMDGILSVDETWTYTTFYEIIQADIDKGDVENQAIASGKPIGLDEGKVQDLSDDDSFLEDESTITIIPSDSCTNGGPSIAMIKEGVLFDADGDDCFESILYTFTVANNGDVDLEDIVLTDIPLFGDNTIIAGPIPATDDGGDGILSVGETWTYQIFYEIKPEDIDAGQVVNQATVSASPVGLDGQVQDLSDDNSFLEDDVTITIVRPDTCTDGAPSIAIIKTAVLADADGDGCPDSIIYTFSITNPGSVPLEDIVLTDSFVFEGEISGPYIKQVGNNDDILEPGEIWTFNLIYELEVQDINLGQVNNQATVYGSPIGQNAQVLDLSHFESYELDAPTVTDVTDACDEGGPSIAVIKTSILVDVDGDGCDEFVKYTFSVTNTGGVPLTDVYLIDEKLFGLIQINDLDDGDDNNNGLLDTGEIWIFTADYDITANDIIIGTITNQATAFGTPNGQNGVVVDFSHPESFELDGDTITNVEDACDDEGDNTSIGVIKTAVLLDADEDGCNDTVQYTFTVRNTGDIDLEEITLFDELLGGEIGAAPEEDNNDDGILSVGETWVYILIYDLTQDDINNSPLQNQAFVYAKLVNVDVEIQDASDDNSFEEDDPTFTDVSDSCDDGSGDPLFGMAMIKTGVARDLNNDGCDDSIRYDFFVLNVGQLDLQNLVITDDILEEDQIVELVITPESQDGVMQPGEEWLFTVIYSLKQEDIVDDFVLNQASVTANIVGIQGNLFAISDDDSYDDIIKEITRTEVSDFCPSGGGDFEIYNGITPNGDGSNDYFQIVGIENYPNNNLKIFNRWGVLVYETDNYGQGYNLFYGISEGRATIAQDRNLPSGTYFYTLTFTGENPGEDSYNGYLYINRD